MRKKENKTPKEILRDEDVEKAIKEVKKFNEKNRFRDGGVLNNSIDILLKYINKLEESHAYVFDAYQDLGKEKFKLEEKIGNKIKELEHEKFKRTQLGVFMLKNYENQRLLAQLEVLKEIRGE